MERDETKILYCTTGIILQRLIHEKNMNQYTHIILDEVHERDIEIDFLLIVVLRLLADKDCNTKIVLMSATLDKYKLIEYFRVPLSDGTTFRPPVIDLTSVKRVHTLQEEYLDNIEGTKADIINYNEPGISLQMYQECLKLIMTMVRNEENSTVLVFLPGIYEIEQLYNLLTNTPNLFSGLTNDPEIHVLHSMLSTEMQRAAFVENKFAKIVLSTNIAESSVTIPNVGLVIDFCLTKHLVTAKGSQNISSLVLNWASRNNCEQRAGRTGRVCPGIVFRLVHKSFYEKNMKLFDTPEMERVSLQKVVIGTKMLNMGTPLDLLALALDPPDKSKVVDAVLHLKELGGLLRNDEQGNFQYDDGALTFIGRIMDGLPIDVSIAKFIVVGYQLGVLREAIVIGAGLSIKSIFTQNIHNKLNGYINKLNWAHGSGSDCLAILNAFNLWQRNCINKEFSSQQSESNWCRRNSLDMKNLNEMRLLVEEITMRLKKFRINNEELAWSDSEKPFVLKICIAGAFGSANFFMQSQAQIDDERESYKHLGNYDIFSSVYFQGMKHDLIGEIYEQQIRKALLDSGVVSGGTQMTCYFDQPRSEKVFVKFSNDHQFVESDDNDVSVYGKVLPEVCKAVKLRKTGFSLTLSMMDRVQTVQYAAKNGIGYVDNEVFIKHKHIVKDPSLIVLPTRAMLKVQGYVTHVDNCNKFFFRPVHVIIGETRDKRYANTFKEIKNLIINADVIEIPKDEAYNQRFVLFKQANQELQRGIFIQNSMNQHDVKLLDVGSIIRGVAKKDVFIIKDKEIEQKLASYPPRVFRCTLTEVQPSPYPPHDGTWTKETIEHFKEGVVNKKATIQVYSVVDGVVSIHLYVDRVLWNEKLTSEGLAEACDESYLSKMDYENRRLFRAAGKFETPEEEFKEMIEENFQQPYIEPPPETRCSKRMRLQGPYSPLEVTLSSTSRAIRGAIDLERSSVNSILLNDDLQSFRKKFCVAVEITGSANRNRIMLRETTLMPNLPGLAVILALVFSQHVEIRRDKTKQKYVSILTGLGYDNKLKRACYGERDASIDIDFDLTEEDIETVNQIRYCLSLLLQLKTDEQVPDVVDAERIVTLGKIKSTLLGLITKKREFLEIMQPMDNFDWNVDQQDAKLRTNPLGPDAALEFIAIPPLFEMKRDEKEKLLRNIEDMNLCSKGKMSLVYKTCELCNYTWVRPEELTAHLASKKHSLKCDQLNKTVSDLSVTETTERSTI